MPFAKIWLPGFTAAASASGGEQLPQQVSGPDRARLFRVQPGDQIEHHPAQYLCVVGQLSRVNRHCYSVQKSATGAKPKTSDLAMFTRLRQPGGHNASGKPCCRQIVIPARVAVPPKIRAVRMRASAVTETHHQENPREGKSPGSHLQSERIPNIRQTEHETLDRPLSRNGIAGYDFGFPIRTIDLNRHAFRVDQPCQLSSVRDPLLHLRKQDPKSNRIFDRSLITNSGHRCQYPSRSSRPSLRSRSFDIHAVSGERRAPLGSTKPPAASFAVPPRCSRAQVAELSANFLIPRTSE
jgi:hypothetical protein